MAEQKAAAQGKDKKEATEGEGKGQGRAVILPNGERRIDYIRDQYYDAKTGLHGEGQKSRSEIKNDINKMLEGAGRGNEEIPYQIVFSATKDKLKDPRVTAKEAAAAAAVKEGDSK